MLESECTKCILLLTPKARSGSPVFDTNLQTTPQSIQRVEVQQVVMSSKKSSSSHKRHRKSQDDVRKVYVALPVREEVITDSTEAPSSLAENPPSSSSHYSAATGPDPPPPSEGLPPPAPNDMDDSSRDDSEDSNEDEEGVNPYETPDAVRPPFSAAILQAQQDNNNYSGPSTFVPSGDASDLSTIPSTTDHSQQQKPPPQMDSFSAAFPSSNVASSPSTKAPLSNTINAHPPVPSTHNRISDFSFNLWHRQQVFGAVEFGTQTSPQKSLNLLSAIEGNAAPPVSSAPTAADSDASSAPNHPPHNPWSDTGSSSGTTNHRCGSPES